MILQPRASRPGFTEAEAPRALGFGEARATTHIVIQIGFGGKRP